MARKRKKVDIEPIEVVYFLGPVECDDCHNTIVVKELEAHHYALDDSGDVIHSRDYYVLGGICTNCGKEFDLVRDGLRFRVKDRANARFEGRGEEFSISLSDRSKDDENPLIK